MNRLQKATVISMLAERLREKGSWAGETHLQKAAYFLQEAAKVPLDLHFVLYKHGPFSFDLRDVLSELSDEDLLVVEPQPAPYGPKFHVTEVGRSNIERHPKTAERYGDRVEKVAEFVGSRGAASLERVATAFMLLQESLESKDEEIASEIVKIKPHVTMAAATAAVEEVRKLDLASS